MQEVALSISSEGETSANVLRRELRKVLNDLLLAHAGREILKYRLYANSQTANGGPAADLAGSNVMMSRLSI